MYTANIGEGPESFATLADVQRAVETRVSGMVSSSEWYGRMRSKHGARILDERGACVATVSYNARLWRASGKREEIVVGPDGGCAVRSRVGLIPPQLARTVAHPEATQRARERWLAEITADPSRMRDRELWERIFGEEMRAAGCAS